MRRVVAFHLDQYNANPLSRGRPELLDPVEVVNGLLDANRNLLFNFSRTRAAKLHANLDLIDFRCGEELLIQLRNTGVPANDEKHHEQIGRDGVLNEPRDRSTHIS